MARQLKSPLGRARGMGSAHEGSHHWWQHKMTTVANIPLVTWAVISIALLAGQPYEVVRAWMTSPLTAVLLMLTIFNLFVHAKIDMQLVIEDYIANKAIRLGAMLFLQASLVLACAISLFSVFKIALG
ncbi:MAG TPA: succinate dehydrogenase, hydrophobic membrane anchor protein [Alphaproteobacteria bacterium]|nr:succinate dehydrogenase, hydrophobic membrane anchor protein [Rhodospirillaceae bacterium]HRJ12631.1 succinate dehydrogenase, hydrophobic membrane anchor protein [Alphaproteobacteria bacterium]